MKKLVLPKWDNEKGRYLSKSEVRIVRKKQAAEKARKELEQITGMDIEFDVQGGFRYDCDPSSGGLSSPSDKWGYVYRIKDLEFTAGGLKRVNERLSGNAVAHSANKQAWIVIKEL